jgi:hypothetical protein
MAVTPKKLHTGSFWPSTPVVALVVSNECGPEPASGVAVLQASLAGGVWAESVDAMAAANQPRRKCVRIMLDAP